MPSTYSTPGVYVEEIAKFPPSVAQVETAIPAFIGHTQKAAAATADDLLFKPTPVSSLLEFETFFGGAPGVGPVNVVLDINNEVQKVDFSTTKKFYLYDSLRLFFANGGGRCFIVSVGNFATSPSLGDTNSGFTRGLNALKKKDEPTIILAPDATLLGNNLYLFQQQALQQAGELKDRVVICDLKNSEALEGDLEEFRNKISVNNLSYGAAYAPWVKVRFPKNVRLRNLLFERTWSGEVLDNDLSPDPEIHALIADLRSAIAAVDDIQGNLIDNFIESPAGNLEETYAKRLSSYNTTINNESVLSDIKAELKNKLYDFVAEIVSSLTNFQENLTASTGFNLDTDVINILTSLDLQNELQTLVHHSRAVAPTSDWIDPSFLNPILASSLFPDLADVSNETINTLYSEAENAFEKGELAKEAATTFFYILEAALAQILTTAQNYETRLEESLVNALPAYKTILAKVQSEMNEIPPSGAIAGIYARVDNERGVWKAPANVGVNAVLGLSAEIDERDQARMNVDPVAGKSINAIRTFAGKGILVWGARTLAGNDNEWRYISVRRFFNMAEESIKKASAQFVFEPNDANTHVKVRAMIENFLIVQWRSGALAGPKPEQAFFVKVGLGETMTADDINNGLMIVEIGMAVVRPAEFMVLRFSHKMQDA